MPKETPESPLSIAEIRLVIEGRSAPTSTLTVRGRTRPQYFFHRDRESGIYMRRYVLGKVDTENGIFPLALAREDMDDVQRSATRVSGFKVIIRFLTSEEVEVGEKAAAEAAKLRDQEREAQAKLEEPEPASSVEPPKEPVAPLAPAKSGGTKAKPKALSKLEALAGV